MKILYLASGVLAMIYTEAEFDRLQRAARLRGGDMPSLIDDAITRYMAELEYIENRWPGGPAGEKPNDKRG